MSNSNQHKIPSLADKLKRRGARQGPRLGARIWEFTYVLLDGLEDKGALIKVQHVGSLNAWLCSMGFTKFRIVGIPKCIGRAL